MNGLAPIQVYHRLKAEIIISNKCHGLMDNFIVRFGIVFLFGLVWFRLVSGEFLHSLNLGMI